MGFNEAATRDLTETNSHKSLPLKVAKHARSPAVPRFDKSELGVRLRNRTRMNSEPYEPPTCWPQQRVAHLDLCFDPLRH
jgi:hypothetical protein